MSRFVFANLLLLSLFTTLVAAPAEETLVKAVHIPCSTGEDDVDPHVTSNGLTLYFSVKTKDRYAFRASRRRSTRQYWGPASALDDSVNTEGDDRGVFVSREGKYPMFFYYSTNNKNVETANFDICAALKTLPGADKVFSFGRRINGLSTDYDEMYPWLTSDGRHLFFSRKTKEGWKLFVASRKEITGVMGWEEPVPVKDIPVGYHHATLTPDNRTMYLEGPLEKDRLGLFVSTRTVEGWSKPEPLTMLNHPEATMGDFAPSLSRDGRLLYFASDRPGGKGGSDLWVALAAQLRKK